MQLTIAKHRLVELVSTQIRSNYLIDTDEEMAITEVIDAVLERLRICFNPNTNKYYRRNNEIFFNPYHSSQYCIFLYILARVLHARRPASLLPDKLYCLNKQLNGVDLYYEVEMPDIFFTDHPVGSVLGRATYGSHFSFVQNCTVGNNNGVFPVIGRYVSMSSGSMILGKSHVGDFARIGAGTIVKDQDVPPRTLVFGASPNLIFREQKEMK